MVRARIFLSYAHADGKVACDYFHNALNAAECFVWRDIRNLRTGDDWKAAALDVIRKVDMVVLFLTPEAARSPEVEWEWTTALEYRKWVVPLVLAENSVPARLPDRIIRKDLTAGYDHEPLTIVGDLRRRWMELDQKLSDLRTHLLERHDESGPRGLFEPVLANLETMLRMLTSPAYPPEVFATLFDVVAHLIDRYPDISEPVDKIMDSTFTMNGNWEGAAVLRGNPETFRTLVGRIKKNLPGIQVRVVVVVMTENQARELDTSQLPSLPADWMHRYKASPQDWEPFTPGESIEALVRQALQRIHANGDCPEPLVARFIDVRTLTEPANRALLQDLRSQGCLVIADRLSMFHPYMLQSYRRSLLDGFISTLVARVSRYPELFRLAPDAEDAEFDTRLRVEFDSKCAEVTGRNELLAFLIREVARSVPVCARKRAGLWNYVNRFEGSRN